MEIWKRNLWVCWFGVFIVSSGTSQMAPLLPLYIEHLGVQGTAAIAQWSGIVYGSNFITQAIVSPIWGNFADKYGRKPMILRASLWLAIIMTAMGFVQNVYQLMGLRLLQGALSGFQAAVIALIAMQTPKERSGWALGILFSGQVGGTLLGPLLGGYMAEAIGFQGNFIAVGAMCFASFLALLLFVSEEKFTVTKNSHSFGEAWRSLPNRKVTICLFATTFMIQLAVMSIQPIITVFIMELSADMAHLALVAGAVFAATGLASVLFAPCLGKISDRVGPQKVLVASLIAAGLIFPPQALVSEPWQLGALRFFLGAAMAGLLPSVNSLIKRSTPEFIAGLAYGYNQSAQCWGRFFGSVLGGQVAAGFGFHYVFFATGALLLANAFWVYQTITVSKENREITAVHPSRR